jgi:hypothetical protein
MTRHGRKQRISRVLHHGNASELLDRPQSGRPIVEIAGEDDANRSRPVHLRRRSEQRINGGPESVFARPLRHSHSPRLDEQVPIRWCDVDIAGLEPARIDGRRDSKTSPSLEDLREQSR